MTISMSKIAFISDIHGNYPALKAVLDNCKKQCVDRIFCLGDLVGYYSQINEVIYTLRRQGIPCILGNHDYALINNKGVIDRSKTCTNVLKKQLTYITSENFAYLKSLPNHLIIEANNARIMCVHGGLRDYIDEYINDLSENYFNNIPIEGITHFVSAHNHKVIVATYPKVKYANSGSVGQPRDHDPRASYIILEDSEFSVNRVTYNIDETAYRMKEKGFPDYISEVLYKGYRIGE